MRTVQGNSIVRVAVKWTDENRDTLHFLVTGPRGGTRAGFIVRPIDLYNELSRLDAGARIPSTLNINARRRKVEHIIDKLSKLLSTEHGYISSLVIHTAKLLEEAMKEIKTSS